jgi:hypothetical protein
MATTQASFTLPVYFNPHVKTVTVFPLSFLNRFNHFQTPKPVSPISACYTKIRRRHLLDPFAPLIAIAQRGIPFTAADGQAFVRLNAPSLEGFYILPVRVFRSVIDPSTSPAAPSPSPSHPSRPAPNTAS